MSFNVLTVDLYNVSFETEDNVSFETEDNVSFKKLLVGFIIDISFSIIICEGDVKLSVEVVIYIFIYLYIYKYINYCK